MNILELHKQQMEFILNSIKNNPAKSVVATEEEEEKEVNAEGEYNTDPDYKYQGGDA